MVNFLSGCIGFAQPVQRIKKIKKKTEAAANKILIPVAKISIFLNNFGFGLVSALLISEKVSFVAQIHQNSVFFN